MGGKISQRAGGAAAATLAESSPARLSALRCPCAPAPSGRPAPRPPTALPSSRAARIKRQLDARNRGAKPRRAAVCRPAAAVARCRHAALPKTAEPRRPQACQHRSLRVEKTITNKMNARPCPPTTLPGRAATPRPPPPPRSPSAWGTLKHAFQAPNQTPVSIHSAGLATLTRPAHAAASARRPPAAVRRPHERRPSRARRLPSPWRRPTAVAAWRGQAAGGPRARVHETGSHEAAARRSGRGQIGNYPLQPLQRISKARPPTLEGERRKRVQFDRAGEVRVAASINAPQADSHP